MERDGEMRGMRSPRVMENGGESGHGKVIPFVVIIVCYCMGAGHGGEEGKVRKHHHIEPSQDIKIAY